MLSDMSTTEAGSYEMLLYKKNGHAIWLKVDSTPIRNEQDVVVLFLLTFRDITAFKEPLEAGQAMMSNLSKFAKLAWTMTRSRNLQISRLQPPGLSPDGGDASASNNNLSGSSNNNNNSLSANAAANNSNSAKRSSSPMVPGSSSSLPMSALAGKPTFLDSLPEYKHEPPRSPPHILLHYSTFKVRKYCNKDNDTALLQGEENELWN